MRHVKQAALTISRPSLFVIISSFAFLAHAQNTIEIQVVEGQNAVQTAGTRSTSPIAVLVLDERSRPVAGATVSLRLPDHDATGLFGNGLRSEIALTDPDGRAAIHSVQWGATAGPCQIRITAVKGSARAGTVATIHITPPSAGPGAAVRITGDEAVPVYRPPSKWKSRWTVVALAAAGAIGGGLIVRSTQSQAPSAAGLIAPAGITGSALQVGPPVIVVNRP